MLVIRFKRTGRKNQPSFRVIVTPKQAGGPAGKPKEYLGWFNPFSKAFELKKERISFWLSRGAKPSGTLHNLLLKAGLIEGKKIPLHGKEKHLDLPAGQTGEAVKAAVPPEEGESRSVSEQEAAPAVEAKTEVVEPALAEPPAQEKPPESAQEAASVATDLSTEQAEEVKAEA